MVKQVMILKQKLELCELHMDSFSYLENTLNGVKTELEKYERTS